MTKPDPFRLVLALATGLLLLAAAAPAHADHPDDWAYHNDWNSPDCASGEITDYIVGEDEETGENLIRLDGWTSLCEPAPVLAPAADPYQFGLVLYADGGARVGALTQYQPGGAPTAFTYHVEPTAEWGDGPMVALCLAYDEERRLSCLGLDLAGSPAIFPISVDDPRVAAVPPAGECGYCVRDLGHE